MTSEQFRNWRISHELTQARCAKLLGISLRNVSRIECGAIPVSRLVEWATIAVDDAWSFAGRMTDKEIEVGI